MQFRLWFEKKKIFGLGRRRSRSFNFSPTAEQPVRDFTTQVGRTLRFPVHSFRVKSIQKEKYQRKFGRKSLLIVCAPSTSTLFFFPYTPTSLYLTVINSMDHGRRLYPEVFCFFSTPRYEVTFKKKRIRERRKSKRIYKSAWLFLFDFYNIRKCERGALSNSSRPRQRRLKLLANLYRGPFQPFTEWKSMARHTARPPPFPPLGVEEM
jgi:hypothetical protein